MTEKDETAARIARQSQMERVIEYCNMMGYKPELTDMVRAADILSRYIVNGWSGKKQDDPGIEGLLMKVDEMFSKYKG